MDRRQLVEKYGRTKIVRESLGMRIAKEFHDGDYVNLGRGLPVLAADCVDPSIDIFYHGEPGIMGYGTGVGLDEWEDIDPILHDAANRHVRAKAGMVFFDMGEAFNMLRGKHLDAVVIGGFEVSQKGDLSSWTFKYPVAHSGISIGGGFDLVVGAKRLIVVVTHLDKDGKPKIVHKLQYPITGAKEHADLVITDLAVFDVEGPKGNKKGLVLREIAPGWNVDELRAVTEGEFEVSPELKVYEL